MEKHEALFDTVKKIVESLSIATDVELVYLAVSGEVWKRSFDPKGFAKATKLGSTLVEIRDHYVELIVSNGSLEKFVASLGDEDFARSETLLAESKRTIQENPDESQAAPVEDDERNYVGPYDLSPSDRLNALYATGVDNWGWHDESLSELSDDASDEEVWSALEAGGVDNWEFYGEVDWSAYR